MNYLTRSELAELIGCKENQRSRMIAWLTANRWRYEVDMQGTPKVARAYHDKKMGITDEKTSQKFAEGPNLQAFQGAHRNRQAVQAHRSA